MNEKIKEAFDQIQAEEELKEHTKEYLARTIYRKKRTRGPVFKMAAAAACFLFLVVVSGSGWLFFTPTAYISIDINPSLEVVLNRFDRVISVDGYNQDGDNLADDLQIRFMKYEEALDQIMENEKLQEYLSNDGVLSFTVAGKNETQSEEILEHVETCTDGHENMYCHSGSTQEVEKAHEAGLSVGKYRAYLALRERDDSLTVEDVRNMSMRQIQELLQSYGADVSAEEEQEKEDGNCGGQEDLNGAGRGSYEKGSGHHGENGNGKNHE